MPSSFTPNLYVDSSEYVEEIHLSKEIAQNLKKRIDELSKKPYEQFSLYAYDFVLLFIPYNNILDLALRADSNIYKYAYDKQTFYGTKNYQYKLGTYSTRQECPRSI
ncbi:DNA recombination protein RmuC [Helicobacter typhlonius]|uniref:DNA recombination protein RmuC n=1 Tax=Helicobacter typhlonius TaxID=76936 RepID=A0A0S4PYQ5_9HELI|nr:DNA recombination protein RmuC [Helicobacter typhlonius]